VSSELPWTLPAEPTHGLTTAAVDAARAQWGPNKLPETPWSILDLVRHQLQDVLVYILLAALAISIVTPFAEGHALTVGSFVDAIIIATILVLNAALGMAQEFQAERAIAELDRLHAPRARVRRDGHVQSIDAADVVPGDVLVLDAGDRLSADARLVQVAHLEADESALTGEALPVPKTLEPLPADTPLAERTCMVHAGTLITRGSGEAVVAATGIHTELGQIAQLVASTRLPTTPLQERLQQLGRNLGVVALAMCGLVGLVGWFRHMPVLEILLIATSLAVSAVPEGLPAVVTVCFALGVRRMAKHQALTRRLAALETLGAVTVVCSDKTGTITCNRMTVVEHHLAHGFDAPTLATVFASCSHGELPDEGDPTELALLAWAAELGAERLAIDVEEVPFTSEAKYMQTRHGDRVFVKGSPEKVLALCDAAPAGIDEIRTRYAEQGLRVLGAAAQVDGQLVFAGLVGMTDPPRDGVAEAVAEARRAGIRTVMITGDDPVTAAAIGAQVGIEGRVRTGRELDTMDADALKDDVADTAIYARVSPQHKVALCQALLDRGEVVAMSGDGVNDAPALKKAHVGVAMGLRGTDVAREAAAIVLADDHFGTIIQAVREGRRIHDNIRRFVLFLLRANFDELLVILAAVAFGLPLPLLPIHILWINLATDGLPALALAAEPAHPGLMDRPPRDARQHLLAGAWNQLVFAAILGFAATLGFFLWRLQAGDPIEHVRAATLTLAISIELLQALSARSERPLWQVGLVGNPWLLGALALVSSLHLVVLYTPLARAFQLEPLTLLDWAEIGGVALTVFVVLEGVKLVLPSRRQPAPVAVPR